MRHDFFFAGLGGQGILFAGQVLARAAMLHGLNVTWYPEYEPEVRGGSATCTVVVADGPVGSPIVKRPHNLLLMVQRAVDKFLPAAADGALAVVNQSLATVSEPPAGVQVVTVPANEIAARCGSERSANVVMLGVLMALRPVVPIGAMERALQASAGGRGPEVAQANIKALHEGLDRGRQLA